jgi:hypothetical protein
LALYRKTGGFEKSWRLTEKQADDRILVGVKIPAPGENQRDWKRWRLRLPCFYGRTLSRTVPAAVPARHAKIHAEIQNLGGRLNFQQFLPNHKNPNSAPKCPITEPKIRM